MLLLVFVQSASGLNLAGRESRLSMVYTLPFRRNLSNNFLILEGKELVITSAKRLCFRMGLFVRL